MLAIQILPTPQTCDHVLHQGQFLLMAAGCLAPAVAAAAEPDGVKITWDNAKGSRGNLGDYYLSVMEAIERQSGGKGPIYFLQVNAHADGFTCAAVHATRQKLSGSSGPIWTLSVCTYTLCVWASMLGESFRTEPFVLQQGYLLRPCSSLIDKQRVRFPTLHGPAGEWPRKGRQQLG